MTRKLKVAIVGSGNIGTDLMIKILRHGQRLEMGAMVGIDAASDGLARAARMGVATTHEGVEGLTRLPVFEAGRLVGIVSRANLVRALLHSLAEPPGKPAGNAVAGDAEIFWQIAN